MTGPVGNQAGRWLFGPGPSADQRTERKKSRSSC